MLLSKIENIKHIEENNFFLIAGPCVIEDFETTFKIAETIKQITCRLKIPFIFKASFKKANRSKHNSFSGIGDSYALNILKEIKLKLKLPVLTDIHSEADAKEASKYVDIIQIPAFLSRQTELLLAAGNTGICVNIKKGQFLSPEAMKFAIEKVESVGNKKIMLTERGTTFGYQDLIVDYRGIHTMKSFGYPVILDITHSLQQPNQEHGVTGGRPELIETLAKAGIATGVDGIFIETHPEPHKAKSDGANMLKLDYLEELLEKLIKIRKAVV